MHPLDQLPLSEASRIVHRFYERPDYTSVDVPYLGETIRVTRAQALSYTPVERSVQ